MSVQSTFTERNVDESVRVIATWQLAGKRYTRFAESKEALENTCKLARLEEEDITELLTSILINPQSSWRRHTMYRRNLSTNDACRYRLHSIIRHLYDLLFRWLLDSMNGILSVHSGDDNERLGIPRISSISHSCENRCRRQIKMMHA